MNINDDDVCACGHIANEHEPTRTGYGECTVDDCDCVHFEKADDEEEE